MIQLLEENHGDEAVGSKRPPALQL